MIGSMLAIALAVSQVGSAASNATAKQNNPTAPKTETKIEKRVVVEGDGAPSGYVFRSDDKGTRVWIMKKGDAKPGELVLSGVGKGGFLGVELLPLTPELRTHFGAKADAGVMVSKVESGSPAEKAGIAVGDIITSFDGKPVATPFVLTVAVRSQKKGDKVSLRVIRDGRNKQLTAVLGERDRKVVDVGKWFIQGGHGADLSLLEAGNLAPVMGNMRKLIVSPEGEKNLVFLKSEREEQLEKRLDELEKRLDKLQKELEVKQR